MIGFDRPLRPQWIYETLVMAEPGQKISDLKTPFEKIAKELTGKEGKRKVRTVLFRCFIWDEKNKTKVKNDLYLKDFSVNYGLEFMTPIYLFYLIGKTEILIKVSDHIFRLYDFGKEINPTFLKKKMIDNYGERDVVMKSTRSFIRTLIFFRVIENLNGRFILKQRLPLNEEQMLIILKLFAKEIIKSPQISLNHLPPTLFSYFHLPNLKELSQKYNGIHWDYQHKMRNDYLLMY